MIDDVINDEPGLWLRDGDTVEDITLGDGIVVSSIDEEEIRSPGLDERREIRLGIQVLGAVSDDQSVTLREDLVDQILSLHDVVMGPDVERDDLDVGTSREECVSRVTRIEANLKDCLDFFVVLEPVEEELDLVGGAKAFGGDDTGTLKLTEDILHSSGGFGGGCHSSLM